MLPEEQIDLRPYMEALFHRWQLIAAVTVVAAAVVLIISFLIPPTYEATALVAVTEPSQLLQFEAGFDVVDDVAPRPLGAYPELATSSEVLDDLMERMRSDLPGVESAADLRELLTAEPGRDPSLVRLTVQYRDASLVAQTANSWADLFVERANMIYGRSGEDQLATLELQLAEAESKLTDAEDALIEFAARDRAAILDQQLTALRQTQATYLERRQAATFLLLDADGLRRQVADRPAAADISVADQLTALALQLRAFNAEGTGSLQFLLDDTVSLTAATQAEQLVALEGLLQNIEARLSAVDDQLTAVEPQILTVQQQKAAVETEQTRLQRRLNIAQSTYDALVRRVEEERASSQEVTRSVRLASEATVPVEPLGPRKLVNMLVAGIAGFMFTVAFLLARTWWQR